MWCIYIYRMYQYKNTVKNKFNCSQFRRWSPAPLQTPLKDKGVQKMDGWMDGSSRITFEVFLLWFQDHQRQ